MPGICETAKAAVDELARDHHIAATPDEVVRLHERGLRVEEPEPTERLALLGCPQPIGDGAAGNLYRLTLQAEIWWRELALAWWGTSNVWTTASLAYAMSHGRQPAASACFPDTKAAAWPLVRDWYKHLACSADELDAAIAAVLADAEADRTTEIRVLSGRLLNLAAGTIPGLRKVLEPILDAPQPDRPKPPNWQDIIDDLTVLTSTPPDYWLHQDRESIVRAWMKALRHDAAKIGMHSATDTAADRQTQAIKALRQEIVAIIEAHKPATEETPAT